MALKAFSKTASILLLLMPALPAQDLSQYTVDAWRKGLREIDQKLRVHQWGAAEKQSRKLADQIIEEAGLGESAAYTLAVVSAFRAIAEAGLGREEEADWHWETALNLFPDIAKTDLSPYGPPAARLKERQPSLADLQPQASTIAQLLAQPSTGNVKAPRVVRQVPPSFPEGLGLMHVAGKVVAETIIGEDGVPHHVRVLQAEGGPAMKYEALEALRQWRFEPAKLEGRPVKVYYVLTINFALKQ
jgi:TonB family protein